MKTLPFLILLLLLPIARADQPRATITEVVVIKPNGVWSLSGKRLPGWPRPDWLKNIPFNEPTLFLKLSAPRDSSELSAALIVDERDIPVTATLLDSPIPGSSSSRVVWHALCPLGRGKKKVGSLKIGASVSEWRTVGEYRQVGGKAVHASGIDFRAQVRGEKGGSAAVSVELGKSYFPPRRAARVVAIAKDGSEFRPAGSANFSQASIIRFYFSGRFEKLKAVRYQTRDYTWSAYPRAHIR